MWKQLPTHLQRGTPKFEKMERKNYDTVAVEAVVPSSTIMKIVISDGGVRMLDPPLSSPLTPAEFFGAHF